MAAVAARICSRVPCVRTLRHHVRRLATLNDFSGVKLIPYDGGGQALVAAQAFAAKETIFTFDGMLRRDNVGDRSIMVGREVHLYPGPDAGEPHWVFLNHSFSPTVHLSHAPVPSVDSPPPLMTATAAHDLEEGAALTIDYTLHEWECVDPFVCSTSGRPVRGFVHLSEAEQEASLPRALPHIKSLYMQHLFGQSSRC